MSQVKINLDSIDDWKATLGQINEACIQSLEDIKSTVGELDQFKGDTFDNAKEIIEKLMESANVAHENISNVQNTLTNIQTINSNA